MDNIQTQETTEAEVAAINQDNNKVIDKVVEFLLEEPQQYNDGYVLGYN